MKLKKPDINKTEVNITTEHVSITPGSLAKASESQIKAFLNFIRTQGVVGLAVGLVLGGAVGVVVKSLVDNIVLPPIGLLMGSADGLKGLSWTIGNTSDGDPTILHYGLFLNDLLNFIVIALVVYIVITLLKINRVEKTK